MKAINKQGKIIEVSEYGFNMLPKGEWERYIEPEEFIPTPIESLSDKEDEVIDLSTDQEKDKPKADPVKAKAKTKNKK